MVNYLFFLPESKPNKYYPNLKAFTQRHRVHRCAEFLLSFMPLLTISLQQKKSHTETQNKKSNKIPFINCHAIVLKRVRIRIEKGGNMQEIN